MKPVSPETKESADERSEKSPASHEELALWQRLLVCFAYASALYLLSGLGTGEWEPYGGSRQAWFAAILAIPVFRLLSSPFFPRPSETIAAAFAVALLVAPIDLSSAGYASTTFLKNLRLAGLGTRRRAPSQATGRRSRGG